MSPSSLGGRWDMSTARKPHGTPALVESNILQFGGQVQYCGLAHYIPSRVSGAAKTFNFGVVEFCAIDFGFTYYAGQPSSYNSYCESPVNLLQ